MIFGAASNSSAAHHGPAPAVANAGTSPRSPFDSEIRRDHARRAGVRHERHREAEMEARGIAHHGVAGGEVGVHRERRLNVSESGDDDAPDALGGIERQVAAMPLHQAPHHVGLAGRAEGRAGFFGLLDRDQGVDDLAALEQELVHRLVDAIDLAPQIGERNLLLAWRFRHGLPRQLARLIGAVKTEIKENVDSHRKRPIYAALSARPRATRRREASLSGIRYGRRQRHARSRRPHARSGSAAFAGGAFRRRQAAAARRRRRFRLRWQIAYQTYGTLNAARSNAVLVCHALTGDQHVLNTHPVTGKPGWWETMVGPGRPIDTERYFVICPNVVGGCMGTSGPASTNPATGMPWGLDFPVITVRDMVRAQAMLLDHLGIDSLFAVAGGSMGGMQVLQWAASYPDRVFAALPIAASTRHSAQNIAFHEVGRQAVMADPEWRGGRYFAEGTNPRRGLAVARMGAHITYLSDAALHRKFGRRFQDRDNPTFSFDADFQVESYLRHQGITFVERFDANSYLYLTRAMDYFDLAADYDGVVANAFPRYADAVLRDLVHQRLAVSDLGIARHRARAQCRGRARIVCRDHDRQGPRRLPARRAGIVRHRARLPGRRRQGEGSAGDAMLSRARIRSDHGGGRARPGRLARRLARGRRHGGARRARARRRLRRRRAAAACWKHAASTAAASNCRAKA